MALGLCRDERCSNRCQSPELPPKAGDVLRRTLARLSRNRLRGAAALHDYRVNHMGKPAGEGHDEAIDFLHLEDDKVRHASVGLARRHTNGRYLAHKARDQSSEKVRESILQELRHALASRTRRHVATSHGHSDECRCLCRLAEAASNYHQYRHTAHQLGISKNLAVLRNF